MQHLCDKIGHLLAAGRWFFTGTLVSSTDETDRHYIAEILLKVELNTITQPHYVLLFQISRHVDVYCLYNDIHLSWCSYIMSNKVQM